MTSDHRRSTTTDPRLRLLLVEDNDGDARYIREILRDARELTHRTTATGGNVLAAQAGVDDESTAELHHESRLADGLDWLDDETPDAVLLDLNLPDSSGLETLSAILDHPRPVPVVVLTGVRDRSLGMEALTRGAEEFLVKDELTADLLTRSVYHAIERHANQRQLERQRDRLERLNQLHDVVGTITDAVIEQSTREEIERTVCEALAEVDDYEFAWIGTVDATTDTLEVSAKADAGNYLETIEITTDPDDPLGQGPIGRAVRSGEIQVTEDALSDPDFEPWRERAREYGFRSLAAIPIVHEETLYGLLNVYADQPGAFSGKERAVIGQLGEIVGHAIAAIERKQALISDDVREIELRIPNAFPSVGGASSADGRIVFDRVVPIEDERYLVYGSAANDDVGVLEELVDSVDSWIAVDVDEGSGERAGFELQLTEPPVVTSAASQGGYVEEAYLEGGDYHLTVQLPPSAEVRRFVEAVRDSHSEAEVRAQRQVTRSAAEASQVASAIEDALTDRQRAVAETAYRKGYFEWPRESTGEEVADSLDIAPATFSQHIREVESRIFETLFENVRVE